MFLYQRKQKLEIGSSSIMNNSSLNIRDALINKDNISKVNTDEEMVNLIKYQKAYEANSIVIKTYNELMKTTLDIKR